MADSSILGEIEGIMSAPEADAGRAPAAIPANTKPSTAASLAVGSQLTGVNPKAQEFNDSAVNPGLLGEKPAQGERGWGAWTVDHLPEIFSMIGGIGGGIAAGGTTFGAGAIAGGAAGSLAGQELGAWIEAQITGGQFDPVGEAKTAAIGEGIGLLLPPAVKGTYKTGKALAKGAYGLVGLPGTKKIVEKSLTSGFLGKGIDRIFKHWGGKAIADAGEYRQLVQDAIRTHKSELRGLNFSEAAIKDAEQIGLSGSEVADNWFLTLADNIAEGSFFSGGRRRNWMAVRAKALELEAITQAERIGQHLSPQQVAQKLGRSLKAARGERFYTPSAMLERVADGLNVVEKQIPYVKSKVRGVKSEGEKYLATLKAAAMKLKDPAQRNARLGQIFQMENFAQANGYVSTQIVNATGSEAGMVATTGIKTAVEEMGDALPAAFRGKIQKLGELASFKDVKNLRHELGQMVDDSYRPLFKRNGGRLYHEFTAGLDAAAEGASMVMRHKGYKGPSLHELYKSGDSLYKEALREFEGPYAQRLMRIAASRPDAAENAMEFFSSFMREGNEAGLNQIINHLKQLKPGAKSTGSFAGDVAAGLMKDHGAIDDLRRMMSEAILVKSGSRTATGISGAAMLKNLHEMADPSLGRIAVKSVYENLYGPDVYKSMVRFANVMARAEATSLPSQSKIVSMGAGGLIIGVATFGGSVASGVAGLVLTQRGLSKVMQSPALTDLLISGMRTPTVSAGSRHATQIVRQTTALLAKLKADLKEGEDYQSR